MGCTCQAQPHFSGLCSDYVISSLSIYRELRRERTWHRTSSGCTGKAQPRCWSLLRLRSRGAPPTRNLQMIRCESSHCTASNRNEPYRTVLCSRGAPLMKNLQMIRYGSITFTVSNRISPYQTVSNQHHYWSPPRIRSSWAIPTNNHQMFRCESIHYTVSNLI